MSRLLQAKKANADSVNRALSIALRSPAVAAAFVKQSIAAKSPSRHGQRAAPVPLTRHGKPNV